MGFAVLGLGFAVPGLGFAVLGLGSVRRAWWPQKEATNITAPGFDDLRSKTGMAVSYGFRDLGLNPHSLGTSGLRGNVRLRNSGAGLPGFVMRLHGLRVGLRDFGFGFCAGRNALSPVTFREKMTEISKT